METIEVIIPPGKNIKIVIVSDIELETQEPQVRLLQELRSHLHLNELSASPASPPLSPVWTVHRTVR